MNHSCGLSSPPAPKLTHSTAPIRFARGKATKFSDGCVTFGVVVRAPVPNGRMSDPFPCGSWPYHSVPDGQRGIRYSSLRFFALRVPAGLDTC
ncbi:hypothetical protein VNO80_33897 [Phaseolus coccineus]|uniref:Uncharacterized protein n=1 Tax=Phaseolus coccineus TaxID=3886 RepID=A0AAN9Q5U4_PHACN